MTYLEVLQSKAKNADSEILRSLLVEQDIDPDREFTSKQKGFDLAYAWYLVGLIISPDWSQGDMSESWDRDSLVNIASNIFNKYGEDNPLSETTTIEDFSDLW